MEDQTPGPEQPEQPVQPPTPPQPEPPTQPPAEVPAAGPPSAAPPGAPAAPVDPHRGTLVLVLGILGLVVGCLPLAIVAWVLGKRDLAAMDEGRMDPSGRGTTNVGRILGMVSVGLAIVLVVVYIILMITGAALFVGAAKQMDQEMMQGMESMDEGDMTVIIEDEPTEEAAPAEPTQEPAPEPVAEAVDPAALVEAGMAAKKAGNLDEAAAKFREAIKAAPKNVKAHWGLAWVLAAQDKKSEAVKEFQQVAQLASDPKMKQEAAAAAARLSE